MSDLCKVWVVGVFFFFPFSFFGQLGKSLACTQRLFHWDVFHWDVFQLFFFFFHGGVPACFSVQVRDAVGIGKAHPTALKMEVEDKWWKIGTCVSDFGQFVHCCYQQCFTGLKKKKPKKPEWSLYNQNNSSQNICSSFYHINVESASAGGAWNNNPCISSRFLRPVWQILDS